MYRRLPVIDDDDDDVSSAEVSGYPAYRHHQSNTVFGHRVAGVTSQTNDSPSIIQINRSSVSNHSWDFASFPHVAERYSIKHQRPGDLYVVHIFRSNVWLILHESYTRINHVGFSLLTNRPFFNPSFSTFRADIHFDIYLVLYVSKFSIFAFHCSNDGCCLIFILLFSRRSGYQHVSRTCYLTFNSYFN
jgi:hypothetical protein